MSKIAAQLAGLSPEEQCIHALFETQVERTPDTVAVIWEDHFLTCRALNQRANQLAHHLREMGVGPEVLVAICVARSAEMVVGLLGILKAGGAYVPLDLAYPQERLAFILEDTQAPILLTQRQLLSELAHRAQIVCLDADQEAIARMPLTNPPCVSTAGNLAYIIYTSGSTGRPKGVAIVHSAAVAMLNWAAQTFPLQDLAGVLAVTSICFDLSVYELFLPLSRGGTVILAQDALHLLGLPARESVTLINTVPSAIAELVQARGIPDSVHTVNLAGEPLKQALVQQVYAQANVERVYNLYGPSEDTTYSTFVLVERDDPREPTIGRPINHTRAYVLDAQQQPLPTDVAGVLYLGGDGLSRGYLNRPALTAERFIPDLFSDECGARLYRTGDVARYLPDGAIEFLGRTDHQVKIRGYRIELGEIEAVLEQHPGVREAVVLAREDEPGDKRLVAYVVPNGRQKPTSGELRRLLQEKLPDYMVPSAFVTLEAMPLTPNGKVDRRALPAPAPTRPELERAFVAPRTLVEIKLAEIWAQVLGIEQIGIHDNFFELGGHSLASTQAMLRVLESFQIEMPLLSIFETPTIASLAERVEQVRQTGQGQVLLPLEPVSRDGSLPLSFAQEQVWFLQKLAPDSIAYNAQITVRLKGHLNVATLERALVEIVRRHEILRTTFPAVNGQPVQLIHPPWAATVPIVDLRAIQKGQREVEAERLAFEASRRPFDTARLPLIRWTLLRLDADDHTLVQIEHHFVHDGWTFAVFFGEVKALYQAFSAGRPSPLPELPVQYADMAVWQRRWMQGETLQAQLSYWKKRLAGSPSVLELPTDRPRPKVQSFRGASYRVKMAPQLYEALKALSLHEGATLFMTLLAAFKILLYRHTGQTDLPVGSSVANRRLRDTELLIGMMVNMVVLRTVLTGNPTFRELLSRVREVALGAYAHQDVPFGKLVEVLRPQRDLSRNALFQVTFDFHDAPVPKLEFSGLTGSIDYRQNDSAKFDLGVLVVPRAEQLIGRGSGVKEEPLLMIWEYDADLFDAATIERMTGHFQVILESIVADPDQHLSDLVILAEAERHRLLVEWNDTKSEYPQEWCIHELFESQVQQTPHAVAVILENQHLTYEALNRRANQLAHYLHGLGVEPEVLVGICAERSVEMVVGLLGILKAGGAYVPLDPSYPRERQAFMLKDTGVSVLLTQERLVERLPDCVVQVLCLDADWEVVARENQAAFLSDVTAENLAYLIYTSGSAGQPKAVVVSQQALVRYVTAASAYFAITPGDRVLQFASISFDTAAEEIYPCLLGGATLVLRTDAMLGSVETFLHACTTEGITVLNFPTAYWHTIVAELAVNPLTLPPSLRLVIIGGEAALPERFETWRAHAPSHLRLVNGYGPTEVTIVATFCELIGPNAPLSAARVPIGQPFTNKQAYVLDADLQPVPTGVPGELYIGSGGLARGYLNRPALTAAAFIPDSFGNMPGARLYKTGDLVRYLPDGNIEFLGRVDHQVKIRGFRVELGEIEAVLSQHPAVQEAVVLAREDKPDNKQLGAYIVACQEQSPGASELRRFLKEKLPEYMVPSAFVTLEALPLTVSGKVDRRVLPAPDRVRAELEEVFVAPRTPTEEVLAKIWRQLLDIDQVGVTDNFFDIGGHSLLATQLVSRLRETFQVEVPLHYFFETPTVAELAESIETTRWVARDLQALPIPRGDGREEGVL